MITLNNLIIGYYKHKINIVLNGYIKKGSMIAVVGANGTGKSTLLKTLIGLLPPISGRIQFGKLGRPIISYLPQIKIIDSCCPLTVFDVVSMGCWPKLSLFSELRYYQKIKVCRALKTVKLLNLLRQYVGSLSGGQFQRMLFARVLVQQASLILLDEPFQGVDKSICKIMIRSIIQLCNQGCTVIVVSHDYKLVARYFSTILMLTDSYGVWKKSL